MHVGLLHWYAAQAVNVRGETIPNSVAVVPEQS
jgi:hypothetical protein